MKYLLEQRGFKAWVLTLNGPGSNPSFTICSYIAEGYFTYISYTLTLKYMYLVGLLQELNVT